VMDRLTYEKMIAGSGHGTATASLINGKTLGVAKEALVVPLRVTPCDVPNWTIPVQNSFEARGMSTTESP